MLSPQQEKYLANGDHQPRDILKEMSTDSRPAARSEVAALFKSIRNGFGIIGTKFKERTDETAALRAEIAELREKVAGLEHRANRHSEHLAGIEKKLRK